MSYQHRPPRVPLRLKKVKRIVIICSHSNRLLVETPSDFTTGLNLPRSEAVDVEFPDGSVLEHVSLATLNQEQFEISF